MFRKKNLMSRKENPRLDFYRKNPRMYRELRTLAAGDKKAMRELISLYRADPYEVCAILNGAQKNSGISAGDAIRYMRAAVRLSLIEDDRASSLNRRKYARIVREFKDRERDTEYAGEMLESVVDLSN